eukprot:TRINITY_DN9917_c0_g1_i2.p1 TRINITY_DN9917_c0_g1~~TRINITY_DN9917_c0_g1_i2.p1  ORF type:complete len:299 (+),score=42.13 TRINITY_DN9917_c0_g1_i2:44-898(+)
MLQTLCFVCFVSFAFGLGLVTPSSSPQPALKGENAVPLNISAWIGKRVVMVSAHPDDIEAGAGSTISLLTAQGTQVYYVIVTNGDKGCLSAICANWTSEQIAVARQSEATAAAAVLGVPASNVFLLDYEDGMVPTYPEVQLLQDLTAVLRRIRADVVMSWYPYPRFELIPSLGWGDLGYHPDHQAVGRMILQAHTQAGNQYVFPQLGAPYVVSEFYTWEFVQPQLYTELTPALLDLKIQAILQHKTQYPTAEAVKDYISNVQAMVAANTPGFTGTLAEGFRMFY